MIKTIVIRIFKAIGLLVFAPILIAGSVLSGTMNYYDTLVDVIKGKK